MCTALFLLDVHPSILFLLVFNRDEFYQRPTKEAQFWEDKPGILAGRDLVGGGTWLGVTRTGRFAFLTNFREVHFQSVQNSPSRGALPVAFLDSNQAPLEYLHSIQLQAYNGTNLFVGDLRAGSVAYLTNRGRIEALQGPKALEVGAYGISNGVLGDRWPKVERGLAQLRAMVQEGGFEGGAVPWEALFRDVLGDRQRCEDESALPDTGLPPELERAMSSIFVEQFSNKGLPYGTRSQAVLAVWRDGRAELRERSRGEAADWKEVQHSFTVEGLQQQQQQQEQQRQQKQQGHCAAAQAVH